MGATAWGVDLTGGALRAIRLERSGSGFRVIDRIEQPFSNPGEGAEPVSAHLPEAVSRCLIDLLQARRATLSDPIFVALPVLGAKAGRVEVPIADPARAQSLLEFELHQALGTELDAFAIRTTPPAPSGAGLACDYFAQSRSLVQHVVTDLRRFGLPFDGLVPGPHALARYAELEWHGRARRLVIECSRTRTDLLYLAEGLRRWRSLPFGCGTLADLASKPERESRGPAADEARRLARQLAREQRDAHAGLFGAHDGTALERVLLLGEGGRHEELRRCLADEIGVEVATPTHGRHLFCEPRLASAQPLLDGTAIGLALGALDRRGDPWSLIAPPRGRAIARLVAPLAGALMLVALGLLATQWIAESDHAEVHAQLEPMRARTRFRAHEEWKRETDQAIADDRASQQLLESAQRARRRVELPAKLLAALDLNETPARLVALDLEPADGGDRVRLVLELVGRGEGAEPLRAHLERELALRRVKLASVTPRTAQGEAGALATYEAELGDAEAAR